MSDIHQHQRGHGSSVVQHEEECAEHLTWGGYAVLILVLKTRLGSMDTWGINQFSGISHIKGFKCSVNHVQLSIVIIFTTLEPLQEGITLVPGQCIFRTQTFPSSKDSEGDGNSRSGTFDSSPGTTPAFIYWRQTRSNRYSRSYPWASWGRSSCSGLTVDLLIGLSILSPGERPREKWSRRGEELLRIYLCFQQQICWMWRGCE